MGQSCHIEGSGNYSTDPLEHVEGLLNYVSGAYFTHAEGIYTSVYGSQTVHAEGIGHIVGTGSSASHVEGVLNTATVTQVSHVEGFENSAKGYTGSTDGAIYGVHVEGSKHVLGPYTSYSHVEGFSNYVVGNRSHTEGYNNSAINQTDCHIEGVDSTVNSVQNNHVEGGNHLIQMGASHNHIEGFYNTAQYGPENCHIEGSHNEVNTGTCHVEGFFNKIPGNASGFGLYSHVEGYYNTVASGAMQSNHVGGSESIIVSGSNNSFLHGEGLQTRSSTTNGQASFGSYNDANTFRDAIPDESITEDPFIFTIGNGTKTTETVDDEEVTTITRSNALAVSKEGNVIIAGKSLVLMGDDDNPYELKVVGGVLTVQPWVKITPPSGE